MRTVLAIAALATSCSKQPEPTPAAAPLPAAQASPAAANDAPGQVDGRAPAPSGGGAVVVVLEPKTSRTFAAQDEKPVMDQVGLTFGPEVLIVRTGQPVEFRNSDDTLHNVHVSHDETHEPAFNVAIPTGESYTYTFPKDGFYRVGCDIHPSMAATVFAASTPYATLADAQGRFTFVGVPPGAWTVRAYAGGRRLERDLEVHGGVATVTLE